MPSLFSWQQFSLRSTSHTLLPRLSLSFPPHVDASIHFERDLCCKSVPASRRRLSTSFRPRPGLAFHPVTGLLTTPRRSRAPAQDPALELGTCSAPHNGVETLRAPISRSAPHLEVGARVPPDLTAFSPQSQRTSLTISAPDQDILHSSKPRSASFLGARTLFTILTGTRTSCIPPDPSQHPTPQPGLNHRPAVLSSPGNSSLLHFLYFEPIPAESRK